MMHASLIKEKIIVSCRWFNVIHDDGEECRKALGERGRELFSRADGRAKKRVFPERLEGEPAQILCEKTRVVV